MMIKSRRLRWVEHVTSMGKMRNAYNILGRTPARKRQFRRPLHQWKDNIKIDVRKIGLEAEN
jgi:hypothetical protein